MNTTTPELLEEIKSLLKLYETAKGLAWLTIVMKLIKHIPTLMEMVERLQKDREDAAGELLINIDEMPPGSNMAKVVIANKLIRNERDSLRGQVEHLTNAITHPQIHIDYYAWVSGLSNSDKEYLKTAKPYDVAMWAWSRSRETIKEELKRLTTVPPLEQVMATEDKALSEGEGKENKPC